MRGHAEREQSRNEDRPAEQGVAEEGEGVDRHGRFSSVSRYGSSIPYETRQAESRVAASLTGKSTRPYYLRAIYERCSGSAGGAPARARSQGWGFVLLAVACLLLGPAARAEEPYRPFPVEVHGFVSQGFILSSGSNYLARSKRGSFEFTEVGVNFTSSITDELSVGMQLFSRDLGPIGNYRPQFDWFYLDYRFRDWLGIRAGRTKLPVGLYNDTSDVDAARVPVLLPQSVYPTSSRDFLLAQTGGEVYGFVPLGPLGAFDYRLYGGTIFIDQTTLASPGATVTRIDVPYVLGGRGLWVTPLDGLRLGGSVQALRIDLDYQLGPEIVDQLEMAGMVPMGFDGAFRYNLPVKLGVASIEYAAHDLLIAAEFSRWRTDYETRPMIVPDGHVTDTRWYVMGSYRITPWFTPGAYYAVRRDGSNGPERRTNYQHDVAVTTRYDITDNWLLKLEGHFKRGTLDVPVALNPHRRAIDAPRDWGVFLVKTTAYF